MNFKFSFFIGLSVASLMFLLSVTSRADTTKFMSTEEVVRALSSSANRAPASVAFSISQTDVDLRAFDSPIESQFGGTCSAFAVASAMDNSLKAQGSTKAVSKRHLWSTYGVYDVDAAVKAASKYDLVEYASWPTYGNRAADYRDHMTLKMTQSVGHEYNLDGALRGLDQNHPVVMAIQVPKDLSNCKPTVSATSPRTKGQHVVEVAGYHLDSSVAGGGYLIVKNSWGTQCGDKGYQYYPFALCQRKDLYCYFVEVAGVQAR
jgi:C1A family cysteine protease